MNTSVAETNNNNLGLIMDVKVELSVRIGSCLLPMREVVNLGEGTVLQLDQLASDPVGLYVNDKLIARGEVVVVEENFGVKITQIVGEAA
jgi:flagellar motor switch protein FliN/FliY